MGLISSQPTSEQAATQRPPAYVSTYLSFLPWALSVCFVCAGCSQPNPSAATFPRKPIKVIVPFAAGGGSDTFTRIVQQAVEKQDLLPQPLVVINVPGAGGTIGSRRVKNARPDGYTMLQLHEGILTSKYTGNADYGPEAFEPVAGTGQTAHVIAVTDTSTFQDLPSLLQAARERPDSIVFAVGMGAPSHYAGMMLEKAFDGAEFRFTQSGGGAKRFASLLGGHTDVTTFSVAEFIDFRSSGLRALAILSEARHALIPDVKTAREQDVEVVSTNMHFWWVPRGTPRERIDSLAEMLSSAMETEVVQASLRQLATDPVVLRGDALFQDLSEREDSIATVSNRRVPGLPNFPLIALEAAVLSGMLVARNSRFSAADFSPSSMSTEAAFKSVGMTIATLAYVASMQFELLTFRPATFLFVLASGSMLCLSRIRHLPMVACLAVVLSIGLHGLFTHLFIVDLP